MEKKYDYTIVGGGPTGLTIAFILAKHNKSVLIIDKQENIGGCHRVIRVNDRFTEHGPRVYSDSYVNTISLLNKMNMNFYDYFIKYKFTATNLFGEYIKKFTWREIIILVTEFFKMLYPPYNLSTQYTTCKEFLTKNKFTNVSTTFIDRLCRLIGGTSIDNYTLYGFLQLLNENSVNQTYQLDKPSDIGLFKDIKQVLIDTKNVDFMVGTVVTLVKSLSNNDKITHITVSQNNKLTKLSVNRCILAIPPSHMVDILNSSNSSNSIKNAFGQFETVNNWANTNKYLLYIQIMFYYDNNTHNIQDMQNMQNTHGISSSMYSNDWGIEYIVLSDYMDFDNSEIVVSTSITITDKKSSVLNKTATECTDSELIAEVYRQLKTTFPNLPQYKKAIINPNIRRVNNKLTNLDDAYTMSSDKIKYIKPQSLLFNNLYTVGTHNGNSDISFTSMESAITNGISFCHEVIPESKEYIKIRSPLVLTTILKIIILLILIIIIYLIVYYYYL
jgi:hypothetical protein